jgi:hypothetical protein
MNTQNLQPYTTETLLAGLYIDSKTGEVFMTLNTLSKFVNTSPLTVMNFVMSDYIRETAIRHHEVQINGESEFLRLHPESTMLAAVKKYRPGLMNSFEITGIRGYFHELTGFPAAVEPTPLTALEQAMQDNIALLEELAEVRAALQAMELQFMRTFIEMHQISE